MEPTTVNNLIRSRRSVFPVQFRPGRIPDATILELLENANWAPTHKHTEPWRFKVYCDDGLRRLSEYMAGEYEKSHPGDAFSEVKYRKVRDKPLACSHVIGIVLHRDPEERVPEWEELAAVACAVENLWISLAPYGIGGYWSSPKSILSAGEFLGLEENERCLGLFYLGWSDAEELPRRRTPIEGKIEWVR